MMFWPAVCFAAGALAAAIALRVFRRQTDPSAGERANRILEISQLAGGLAHEIRNPLSTQLLNLKLLEEDLAQAFGAQGDALRRARLKIGVARAEAERLQRMLDEFLLLVGPVRLRREVVDLNTIVQRLAEFYGPEARRQGITLRVDRAHDAVPCELDPQVFPQAVLNLLINAQQAMKSGGEIMLTSRREGQQATLRVADTGEGMTEDVAAKAMQAFYSTKPNGSGLGLSTTSRIVTEHGGTMGLQTEAGKGACFEIRLPLATARPGAVA